MEMGLLILPGHNSPCLNVRHTKLAVTPNLFKPPSSASERSEHDSATAPRMEGFARTVSWETALSHGNPSSSLCANGPAEGGLHVKSSKSIVAADDGIKLLIRLLVGRCASRDLFP